jgi:hypothetical protein
MSLRSSQNEYTGINAHLNSLLQNMKRGWLRFHNTHINHIADALNDALPAGYVVDAPASFQISSIDATGEINVRLAEPDIAIAEPYAPAPGETRNASRATLVVPTALAYDETDTYFSAVAIRAIGATSREAIAWIELLSPSNKPAQPGWLAYREKRQLAVEGGIVVVEIDYLHQTPPVLKSIPSYPGQSGYPYRVSVTIPRPTFASGVVEIYGWQVDDPIPKIDIPLLRDDQVVLDLDTIYQITFRSRRSFADEIDYAIEPPRIETYSQADQDQMRARMAALRRQDQ